MTGIEANTIAAFRLHFGCTFNKTASLARAVFGRARCFEMVDDNSEALLGRNLISRMEEVLCLKRGESDKMVMSEMLCMSCNNIQWVVCYPDDTEKECGKCGKMATVFTIKEDK